MHAKQLHKWQCNTYTLLNRGYFRVREHCINKIKCIIIILDGVTVDVQINMLNYSFPFTRTSITV